MNVPSIELLINELIILMFLVLQSRNKALVDILLSYEINGWKVTKLCIK